MSKNDLLASYPHPLIAKEGWGFIAAGVGAAVIASVLESAVAYPLWGLVAFLVQFFRDPPRPIPSDPLAVLSPADGRIVAIEPCTDPWLQRPALKVSVFMNVFNVHSNRSPVSGVVRARHYHAGAFLNAALDKASERNERNALIIEAETGHQLTVVQVAGLIARRILCYVEPGMSLTRGARFGFIRFGSRLDLYLPPDSRISVAIGERVWASATIIAYLVPHTSLQQEITDARSATE